MLSLFLIRIIFRFSFFQTVLFYLIFKLLERKNKRLQHGCKAASPHYSVSSADDDDHDNDIYSVLCLFIRRLGALLHIGICY